MNAAYIEALNMGFLRERESKGDIRDPLLLDEVDRLNEAIPSVRPTEEPPDAAVQVTTTIPPPSWKR